MALNPSASGSVSIGQAVAPWSIEVVGSVLADLMVLEPAVGWGLYRIRNSILF